MGRAARAATGVAAVELPAGRRSVAQAQIRALPSDGLVALAEVMSMLELTPLASPSINEDNPEGNVRVVSFGSTGMITYLILEDQRRVDVLEVLWVG